MSRGQLYFLGQNPDFTIISGQIFSRNEVTGGSLMIPFMLTYSSIGRNNGNRFASAEVLSVRGELRTEEGIRISETITYENSILSGERLIFQSQFSFSFTHDIIHKVEEQRNVDLNLNLSITIQAALYSEGNSKGQYFVSGFEKGHGNISFVIPQSEWVGKLLPKLGYDSLRLIEIPAASLVIPDVYAVSLGELAESKRLFTLGQYDHAVAHCRSALDPIRPNKDEIRQYIDSDSEYKWIKTMIDKTNEWLNDIVRSTYSVTSKTHHMKTTGHFDRSDAEIIIMMTTAIIAYIGRLK